MLGDIREWKTLSSDTSEDAWCFADTTQKRATDASINMRKNPLMPGVYRALLRHGGGPNQAQAALQ